MNGQGFFEQGWWQGVGGVFGILAFIVGVVALIVAIKQNKRKSLSYYTLSSESLMDIDEQVKESITVQFQGHIITQLHVLRVRLINDGNIAITKNDFGLTPISFRLRNCRNIINCLVVETNPMNIEVEMSLNKDDEVLIKPLLLNPNDFFDLKIIFDGTDRDFNLNARIEGISKLKEIQMSEYPKDIFISTEKFVNVLAGMIGAYVGLIFVTSVFNVPHSESIMVIGGTLAVFVILIKTTTERFTAKAKATFGRRK